MDEWNKSVYTDTKDLTSNADDFGCEADSKSCLWLPVMTARTAKAVVANIIVPKSMALAMVDTWATADGS